MVKILQFYRLKFQKVNFFYQNLSFLGFLWSKFVIFGFFMVKICHFWVFYGQNFAVF